jgi:hypothetical protein
MCTCLVGHEVAENTWLSCVLCQLTNNSGAEQLAASRNPALPSPCIHPLPNHVFCIVPRLCLHTCSTRYPTVRGDFVWDLQQTMMICWRLDCLCGLRLWGNEFDYHQSEWPLVGFSAGRPATEELRGELGGWTCVSAMGFGEHCKFPSLGMHRATLQHPCGKVWKRCEV